MKLSNQEMEKLLIEKFNDVIPKIQRPEWFEDYVHYLFFVQKHLNVLQLTVYFLEEIELNDNLFWREDKGQRNLISRDPKTSTESIIINYDNKQINVFIGHLDKNLKVSVIKSFSLEEIQNLDRTKLILNKVRY